MRSLSLLPVLVMVAGCIGSAPSERPNPLTGARQPPPLPDSSGFGTHVLALARAPNRTFWVGTYGRGIYVLPSDSGGWQRIASRPNDSTALSWNFVNALAFTDSTVWYGTIGNGFGRSRDRGRTWKNWQGGQLGAEWLYVVPGGIKTRGDTVYIATADGLRITWDDGATWRCSQSVGRVSGGAAARSDGCTERHHTLPTEYLLSLEVTEQGALWAGHLKGVSVSTDGGRNWSTPASKTPIDERVRAIRADSSWVWLATERRYFRGAMGQPLEEFSPRAPGFPQGLPGQPRELQNLPGMGWPLIATSFGMAAPGLTGEYHVHYLPAGERFRPAADVWTVAWLASWPIGGTAAGLSRILAGEFPPAPPAPRGGVPEEPRQPLFSRPISAGDGNPYIDATYPYGSTMGGNFQQHQGVEFNNPAGTPVRAVSDGIVVFAGPAEAGANTVAIRHDQRLGAHNIFSTYFHNSVLSVRSGQRVRAGDEVARVGNTGRATNDHLHVEIHAAPTTDSAKIVHPDVRFPEFTVNPQLWLEPLPGTGIVAGRVLDATGQLVRGARIHGLVQAYPEETPLSFVETYQDRAHPHPLYNENFAIGDVPAGEYLIGVLIGDRRTWRRITVQAGKVTFLEIKPD